MWALRVDEVLAALDVDSHAGLGDEEVTRRRLVYGSNSLQADTQKHFVAILVNQFKSIVIALLLAAGILAMLFADFAEAAAIFAVVVLNALIGFITELRAIRSMAALRQLAKVSCTVLRRGMIRRIPADELVQGDIVHLQAGDLVPADLRLVYAAKLSADESSLTGESLPVDKHIDPLPKNTIMLERHNFAFKGSAITRGNGRGVVVATGLATELGRIFEHVSSAKAQRTPLEKRLDILGNRLAWAVIGIGVALALIGILTGRDAFLAVQVAIALSVAAIPEGLPIVATIALAHGMWRMAKRNALITKLSAVETLGATSVILTDKTGTLTENRMTATTALLADQTVDLAEGSASSAAGLEELLVAAALCNNASYAANSGANNEGVGDPTEVALLAAASTCGIWRDVLVEESPEIHEDPFDPAKKRMATIHDCGAHYKVAVKGSPEVILPLCSSVITANGVRPIGAEYLRNWLERVESLCERGLRTIAIAAKSVDRPDEYPYKQLTLLGVIGLEDPVRPDIKEAINRCRRAGVLVVMVTGDHAKTAQNIAKKIGVLDAPADPGQSLGGEDVDRLFAEGRDKDLLAVRVFSRVTPEQKLRLISLYQQHGHVVAMTGDGVNDAPALKKADIGVAMGLRGTAIAREAAEMVLQDDRFGTIVAAIGHGRLILQNIRKFVVYLLSCNSSEVLIVSLATLSGAPLPLLPLQILFLNLVTDVFPALSLSIGPEQPSLMKTPPRPGDEALLSRRQWIEIGIYGVILAVAVLAAMTIALLVLGFDRERAVTVAFCTLALAQIWHVFNMRASPRRFFDNEITRNVWVWLALGLCLGLVLAAVYVPALSQVLQLTSPGQKGWPLVLVLSLVPLLTASGVRYCAGAWGQKR